ncbi:MAG TPA: hypothetical protein VFP31_09585 [Gaiellaceae bacterium]|jgi:hypothetical protein|nr:hypothetical protein [Gaiellaceae bacterium]
MSLRYRFNSRRSPDPRVAVMLEKIVKEPRPSAQIVRNGLQEYGTTDLERRLPPPYARAY